MKSGWKSHLDSDVVKGGISKLSGLYSVHAGSRWLKSMPWTLLRSPCLAGRVSAYTETPRPSFPLPTVGLTSCNPAPAARLHIKGGFTFHGIVV